jgi:hypothetical protein
MSYATYEDLRQFIYAKTDDPMIRARRRATLRYGLEAEPEVLDEVRRDQARIILRRLLAVRCLTLSTEDEARIDACTDLDTLGRWHGQAAVAGDVAEALR